jgi:hypothetical protein
MSQIGMTQQISVAGSMSIAGPFSDLSTFLADSKALSSLALLLPYRLKGCFPLGLAIGLERALRDPLVDWEGFGGVVRVCRGEF